MGGAVEGRSDGGGVGWEGQWSGRGSGVGGVVEGRGGGVGGAVTRRGSGREQVVKGDGQRVITLAVALRLGHCCCWHMLRIHFVNAFHVDSLAFPVSCRSSS